MDNLPVKIIFNKNDYPLTENTNRTIITYTPDEDYDNNNQKYFKINNNNIIEIGYATIPTMFSPAPKYYKYTITDSLINVTNVIKNEGVITFETNDNTNFTLTIGDENETFTNSGLTESGNIILNKQTGGKKRSSKKTQKKSKSNRRKTSKKSKKSKQSKRK